MSKSMMCGVFVTLFFVMQMQGQNPGELKVKDAWLTNITEASEQAGAEQKAILLVFSGSDWCKPCIMFERNVLNTETFLTFAEENLVLLNADFPASKKNRLSKEQIEHNEKLAERYNPKGLFPTAVLLNVKGELVNTFGYHKGDTPEKHIAYLQQLLNNE